MRFPGWQIKQWLDTKTEGCKKYEKNGDLRTGETEEVMMLFKKIDKDAEVAVTSEKLKGGEADGR